MTIHPTETDYPTSLVERGAPFAGDVDPPSSFMLPGTTHVVLATPKLFSSGAAGQPMGMPPTAGGGLPLEASQMSALGLLPPDMSHPKILIGAGAPPMVNVDPSSNFMPPGTTGIVVAASELYSHGGAGQPMGVPSRGGGGLPLGALQMSAFGPLPPSTDHPKILIGAGAPPIVSADPSSSFTPPGTMYVVIATIGSFSSGGVGGITQGLHEEMIVSLLEPSPLSKLLTQLATLQHTLEDERWPGATWPDAQAFADAQTFIRRLPLNVVPLPEISLADDGEVNFLWQSDGVYIDLGFYGTGTCSYFARGKDGRRLYGDAAPASEGLPPEITALFAA